MTDEESELTPREERLVRLLLREIAQFNLVTSAVLRAVAMQPSTDIAMLIRALKEEEERLSEVDVTAKSALRQMIANAEGYG